MSKQEKIRQMEAALRNILEISTCDFAKHQAAWGLGLKIDSAVSKSNKK
ncbi:hypothetical protein ACFSTH_08235 [Paenibacillus yanchengensis]|uniref:Small, acid-soluble spore protein, alpha/beta type n=1 Tax=Paenibacillus yanchengensis TaxID=2035833 RepID=A0ABW4YL29_9BACL